MAKRKKLPPINDPLQDAKRRDGINYSLIDPGEKTLLQGKEHEAKTTSKGSPQTPSPQPIENWFRYESFYTTGRFSGLDKGFVQHCGPTAITNILITLDRRYGYEQVAKEEPEEIFRKVAALGRRYLFYINRNILHYWGGSNIWLMGFYLRSALRKYGIRDRRIHLWPVALPKMAVEQLKKGRLLLLSVYHHKIYGSHSVVAYGLQNLKGADGCIRTYIQLADGWAERPRYLAVEDLKLLGYCTIS